MKRIVSIAVCCLLGTYITNAQNKVYCEIIEEVINSKKTRIYLDYGQDRRYPRDIRFNNGDGKSEFFSSRVEALNVMSALGWELEEAYVKIKESSSLDTSSSASITHYILSNDNISIDALPRLPEMINAKKTELDL